MASLHDQKLGIRDRIFEEAAVQHREMWRTEAEDRIVEAVIGFYHDLPAYQLERLAELLKWHRVHVRGESRSSLMAMLEDESDNSRDAGGEL